MATGQGNHFSKSLQSITVLVISARPVFISAQNYEENTPNEQTESIKRRT